MIEMSETPNSTFDIQNKSVDVVTDPGEMDVLLGRGGRSNYHPGNKAFRALVDFNKRGYKQASTNKEKQDIAKTIVDTIRKDNNRFLKFDTASASWSTVSYEDAQAKTSQALREASRSWKSASTKKVKSEDDESSEVRSSPSVIPSSASSLIGTPHHIVKAEQIDALVQMMSGAEENSVSPVPRPPPESPSTLSRDARQVTNDFNEEDSTGSANKKRSKDDEISSAFQKKKKSKSYTAAINDNPLEANIVEPRQQDVLFGRGGRTNHHPGNKRFRQLVEDNRQVYRQLQGNKRKQKLALEIVELIYNEHGRFLKLNSINNMWQDVGKKAARGKTSQALREAATTLTPVRKEVGLTPVSPLREDTPADGKHKREVRHEDEKDVGLMLLRLRASSPSNSPLVEASAV